MTSVAEAAPASPVDWRVVLSSGIKLGIVTSIGVAVFAFLSRGMSGTVETFVQSGLILVGGATFAFGPAFLMRPTNVDSVAWTAMIGLLGALVFTVIDIALFRNINLYHWTWDQIGGGSPYWYHPVWWMGSAFVAWLGSWSVTNRGEQVPVASGAVTAIGLGVVVSALLIIPGIVPLHSASVALGFTLGLVAHVPLTAVMRKG